ncbi:MAG: FtsX-like permease family protein [Limibacillus sp.]
MTAVTAENSNPLAKGFAAPLFLRLARRELRGGLKGFRVFLACLALGVATIAGVGSLSQAMLEALRVDGRALLGGQVELRLIHRAANEAEMSWLRQSTARLSQVSEVRTMARGGGNTRLVELKAIDEAYPLYGEFRSDPPGELDALLAERDGRWGAVAEPSVLNTLGVEVGDALTVGDKTFELRAVIAREPDRTARAFTLGPHVIVDLDSLSDTPLLKEGSLVQHHYRLDPGEGFDMESWVAETKERFPEAGWRIRDLNNAAPGMERFIERVTLFMTLVGLTSLLVGGVGVANAVRSYLDGKRKVIATLKTLGAPARSVFAIYLTQILVLGVLGIAIGLLLGALVPYAVGPLLAERLNFSSLGGVYAAPLAMAALFGFLVTLAFSLWPLGKAQALPAAALFRDHGEQRSRQTLLWVTGATALAAAALAALAIFSAEDKLFASGFVAGAVGALLVFRLTASGVMRLAARLPRFQSPGLRLAVANLHRPGSSTGSVVVSLGLGLTVLVAIALIEGNLSRQVSERIPEEAPGFYFIDIQPDQVEPLKELVRAETGSEEFESVPMLRGRIAGVNGKTPEEMEIPADIAWVFRGDRGLTWSREIPLRTEIVEGSWWPEDYSGKPLVSLDHEVFALLGLSIGDTLSINILGRNVEVEIANTREIEWQDLQIDFVMIFSPGLLEAAPQSHIATVKLDPAKEDALERAVVEAFPNISAIRVKEALARAAEFFGKVAIAVSATAGLTLLSGVLVLAGAFAAGHQRRVYDSVVLKVLGATRARVAGIFLLQYGLLGLITAAIAAGIGTLAGFIVVTQVMEADFIFLPETVFPTALLAAVLTLVLGFIGTWRALSVKSAPLLRNE